MVRILLVVYDNSSHIPFFPQNIFHIHAALISQPGNKVGVWHQDLHHGSTKVLTDIIDKNHWDIVGFGFVAGYYQYRIAKQLSEAINASKNRKKIHFVVGGHGPAAEPEYFLKKLEADSVVVGDGEQAIKEIAQAGKMGIVYGKPCTDDSFNLDVYGYYPIDLYRLIRWPTSKPTDFCFPILSSRGCKYACSFCYRMREGFHMRDVNAIIEEIKFLYTNFEINHFQFSDELLMANEARTGEICEAILALPFAMKWDCNGRLNFAKPEILKLMRRAGCEYINYGIESLNQDLLNQMHKGLTIDRIHQGVKDTLKYGMSPGLNLIWGFPGDTVDNLQAAVDFLIKYDPCHELRTIRPVTPYPGTELYKLAIEKGLLDGPEDFYERKHVNSDLFTVNFMDIQTDAATTWLGLANSRLVRNYCQKRGDSTIEDAWNLYNGKTKSFRGFRSV